MSKQSLLKKAKSLTKLRSNKDGVTREEKELILAWVKNEIRLTQVGYALGRKAGAGVYSTMVRILRSIVLELLNK